MSRYFRLFALILVLACLFATGCSDRGTNSSGIVIGVDGLMPLNHVVGVYERRVRRLCQAEQLGGI